MVENDRGIILKLFQDEFRDQYIKLYSLWNFRAILSDEVDVNYGSNL
jgi:hypothetical protein